MVAVITLLVVPAGLALAVLTMPRWSVRVIQRNRIWTLRDLVSEDVQANRLPSDHNSVQALIAQLHAAAEVCPTVSILSMYAYRRTLQQHSDTWRVMVADYARSNRLEGMQPEARVLFDHRRRQFYSIIRANLLFGSWAGLAVFSVSLVRTASRRLLAAPRRRAPQERITVWTQAQQQPSRRLDEWISEVCLPEFASRGAARAHAHH